MRTEKTYEQTWKDFDAIIGLQYLKLIHVNDSKKDFGSHVDRHENIGKGKLGLLSFKLLFNDKRFITTPKILETPDGTLENYAMDIKIIKELIKEKI
jgi:endonuclease IV